MKNWQEDAKKHAFNEMPRESCGLLAIIKGKETYWPCKNLAEGTMEHFFLNPDDWADCEDQGEILAIVHSHPKGSATASDNDKAACEHISLPWHIFSCEEKKWNYITPSGYKAPSLIGRGFIWGVHDCWSIVTDWYKEVKNIDIPYWERPKKIKDFVTNPEFEYALPKLNFIKQKTTDDLQVGDVLLFTGRDENLTHVAVYIGEMMILNHNIKGLSCRENFDLQYKKNLKQVYRYAN
jgi:proteasome lid subunit RPN8/RPN11|tara:strand:- start:237 stop:947 length:711 start_codon:yes stop_codon:yes gene_type:complete